MDRYHRQTLLPQIGSTGQSRLRSARVLLVGCGALGSALADQLVRAGVGFLRLVDRDIVEMTNLQRQMLYDESDVAEQTPKAVAAARRLAAVNSNVTLDPVVTDVHGGNVEELIGAGEPNSPVNLILDGTDNADTRYLLNDAATKHAIPWIYGACVGMEGRVMLVRPGETPCLRCIFPQPPAPGELPTCDTAGVLGPAAMAVAAFQAAAAIRMLVGDEHAPPAILSLNLWRGRLHSTSLADATRPDCPACGRREFEFLDRPQTGQAISLCGRKTVQVRPARPTATIDLASVADRLRRCGTVQLTPYLLRFATGHDIWKLSLFGDGRALIEGINDPDQARSIYAKWVGS